VLTPRGELLSNSPRAVDAICKWRKSLVTQDLVWAQMAQTRHSRIGSREYRLAHADLLSPDVGHVDSDVALRSNSGRRSIDLPPIAGSHRGETPDLVSKVERVLG